MLPNLSGLHIVAQRAPGGRGGLRRALRIGSAATESNSKYVTLIKETWDLLGPEGGAEGVRKAVAKALGTLFAKSVHGLYENGVVLSADEQTVTFKYFKAEKIMRVLTLSGELLIECFAYFAKPILEGHMQSLSNVQMASAWSAEKKAAALLFYDFSFMDVADPDLRGMCATDVRHMTTSLVDAPPREYVREYLCQPWYFRQFMVAFEKLSAMWESGDILDKSFQQLVTVSWEALGWGVDPMAESGTMGAFTLSDAYPPTIEDLRLFSKRSAYKNMSMVYVDSVAMYWEVWGEFLNSSPTKMPPMTPFDVERSRGSAWGIFIKREPGERDALLKKLETMWNEYKEKKGLVQLVDLIQQFNGNHYFRDGNGRFSMLLIQLHMRATKNQLVYFWDHNPNGPCLAKYVNMLQLAPCIPTVAKERPFDKIAIKHAFEKALEFQCDESDTARGDMPYVEPDIEVADPDKTGYRILGVSQKRGRSNNDLGSEHYDRQLHQRM